MFKNKKKKAEEEAKKKEEEEKKKREENAKEQSKMNRSTTSITSLVDNPSDIVLTEEERKFLLNVQRGDVATIQKIIDDNKDQVGKFDINCHDPLGRSALTVAIENENLELIELLLEKGVRPMDALLKAIDERYVEGVEVLLQWEEENHKSGEPYSWENLTRDTASYTKDITPLILAAHHDHYEILKLLLDRGATLPMPHDMRCGCDECLVSTEEDSLRHSLSRINAYRALASPSLISLSSKDPILTSFELCGELERLAGLEQEFKQDYEELTTQVMKFNTDLLDQTRSGDELSIILNYKTIGDPWMHGDVPTLDRLKLAIEREQKTFVAHPHVQQMLGAMWYDGLGNFKRQAMLEKVIKTIKLMCMFPVHSMIYAAAPQSATGQLCRKPFVKFLSHSASYLFFLMLLALASQNLEYLLIEWFGSEWFQATLRDWKLRSRGAPPGLIEFFIVMWVSGQIWAEVKALWKDGILAYIKDLWNLVDFVTNTFFMAWILLRFTAFILVYKDIWLYDKWPWYKREEWHTFDPMLLADGCFGAAMIFSYLKLVHVFSVNPHLGPLQISLGRMVFDIMKFFILYTLVLFAFGCGLNQMMWYYADYEMKICYAKDGINADWDDREVECSRWRRFINLFETSQSLFWASFGLVELYCFDLRGIGGFTRFWALLMFGSYSVINIIVLLNLLIAMMSNSYMAISECSDVEWKFARTNLWMSYFEEGATVPPPFNMIPTPKGMLRMFGVRKQRFKGSMKDKSRKLADNLHQNVMRLLVRRYITEQQRSSDDKPVTEDDINEVKQDISTFRYQLIDIMKNNGLNTSSVQVDEDNTKVGKKGRAMERRLMKGFNIGMVEGLVNEIFTKKGGDKNIFGKLAKAMGGKSKSDWNARASKRKKSQSGDQIGSSEMSLKRSQTSIKQRIAMENEKLLSTMNPDRIVEYNPNLRSETPATRVAYAKFKVNTLKKEKDAKREEENKKKMDEANKKDKEGLEVKQEYRPTTPCKSPTPVSSPTPTSPPPPKEESRPTSPDAGGGTISPSPQEWKPMTPPTMSPPPGEWRPMTPPGMTPMSPPRSPSPMPMTPKKRFIPPKEPVNELEKFKIRKVEKKDDQPKVGKLPTSALKFQALDSPSSPTPRPPLEGGKKKMKLITLEDPNKQAAPQPQKRPPPKVKLIKPDNLIEPPPSPSKSPTPPRAGKIVLPNAFQGVPAQTSAPLPPKIKPPPKKITNVDFGNKEPEKKSPAKSPAPKLKKIEVVGGPVLPKNPIYSRPVSGNIPPPVNRGETGYSPARMMHPPEPIINIHSPTPPSKSPDPVRINIEPPEPPSPTTKPTSPPPAAKPGTPKPSTPTPRPASKSPTPAKPSSPAKGDMVQEGLSKCTGQVRTGWL